MARIMVVEDDVYMREELTDLLRKSGYETASLFDFENAIPEITEYSPDLVLLDINLPFNLRGLIEAYQRKPLRRPECRKSRSTKHRHLSTATSTKVSQRRPRCWLLMVRAAILQQSSHIVKVECSKRKQGNRSQYQLMRQIT